MSLKPKERRKRCERVAAFGNVLENSPAIVYAKRKDGVYTYINREWERFCDLTREQVIGKTDYDLFPPDIAKQFGPMILPSCRLEISLNTRKGSGHLRGEQLFLSKNYH